MMKTVLTMAAMLFLGSLLAFPANAGCREQAAARFASKPGAKILSVRTETAGNGDAICVVTVRQRGKPGKPPRVVTRKFRP